MTPFATFSTHSKSRLGRLGTIGVFFPYFALQMLIADLLVYRRSPLAGYREYKKSRGMSRLHDCYDWLGGYPFEVAKPEQIFDFFKEQGYTLERLKTCGGGLGCNEFVFKKQ